MYKNEKIYKSYDTFYQNMKRKIIQIAGSTQLISLPRQWCIQQNIKKGAELEIEEQGSKVIVWAEREPIKKETEIDITPLDRSSVLHLIRALYRAGYTTIRLRFKKQLTTHYRTKQEKMYTMIIHEEVNRLSGLEIIEEKENIVVLRGLSEMDIGEFDTVLRRIFMLIGDAFNDYLTGVKNNDHALIGTVEQKHDTITKFISYCLRILNIKGYKNPEKITFIYHIIASLDKITDVIKYAARSSTTLKTKMHPQAVEIVEAISKIMHQYQEIFYKFEIEKVKKFSEQREKVKRAVEALSKKIVHDQVIIINNLEHSLEIMLDIIEARMSMEF